MRMRVVMMGSHWNGKNDGCLSVIGAVFGIVFIVGLLVVGLL